MLFLTVYGPELESLFRYVYKYTQHGGAISREHLYSVYLPHTDLSERGQTKNVEDALNYLKAARLIEGDTTYSSLLSDVDTSLPFGALLLYQFRQLERLSSELSLLDLLYITL